MKSEYVKNITMQRSSILPRLTIIFSGILGLARFPLGAFIAIVALSDLSWAAQPSPTDQLVGGMIEVDWTPGSSWQKYVAQMPRVDPKTKTFVSPAFGRDVLNARGKEAERLGLLNGKKPKAMVTPHSMVLASDSTSVQAMSLPPGATLGLGEQDTQLLEEIAWGLNYDPLKIFNWVLTKVEYVPYYGLVQGAHVTALEQKGNDFDQCVLLVSLLKQSGISDSAIQYIESDVTYSAADIDSWLKWDFGYASNGFTYFGVPNTPGTNSITVRHITVKVTINGTTYWLDPSFKQVTKSTPVSLSQVTNAYSASDLTAKAGGSAPSDDEYSGADVNNFENTLCTVAANYVRNADQNYHGRDARSLLGIPVLTQAEVAALPTSLPQQNSTRSTWSAIPADRSQDLQLTFGTSSITYHWCDLADDTFNIAFDSTGHALLYRETALQLTESGTPSGGFTAGFSITYPQAWANPISLSSGAMSRSGRSVLLPTFCASRGRLGEMTEMQADKAHTDPNSDDTLIHTLELQGLRRAVHNDNMLTVTLSISGRAGFDSGSIWFYHERGANWWVDGPANAYALARVHANSIAPGQYFGALGAFSSGTEHLCLEEMTSPSAGSTVAIMESALRSGYSIFRLTPQNWNSMIGRINGGVLPAVQTYVQTNQQEAFVPSTYNVTIYGSNNFQCAGAYLPVMGTNEWTGWWKDGSWIISNGFNGGGTNSAQNAQVQAYQSFFNTKYTFSPDALKLTLGADPVDLVTGAFTFDAACLKVGNSSEPNGMDLHAYYSTSQRLQNSVGIGNGWTHSYDIFAVLRDANDVDIRAATVAEIAPLVVQAQYLIDIDTANPSAKEIALRAMTAAWATRQHLKSKATVALGRRRIEFEKVADGTFIQSSSVLADLTELPNGGFNLAFRNGNSIAFEAGDGKATSITDPYGNVLTLTYTAGQLALVKDAYGRTLTFNYSGTNLSSVTDSSGRSIVFGQTGSGLTIAGPNTGLDAGMKAFAMNAQGEVLSVTDERNRTVITNLYDEFHRVYAQQPLGDGAKTTYVGYAPGQAYEADAFGNRAWTTFDSRGRRTAYKDAVGGLITWSYDGADHVIAEQKASGATTQYTYDSANILRAVTDPLGHTRTIQTDSQNRPQYVSDFNGKITTYQYNDFASPVTPSTTVYTQDPTSITLPGGIVYSCSYDTNGRIKTEHRAGYASGQSDTYAYDSSGSIQSVTHPGAAPNVDTYVFDSLGNEKEFDDRNGAKTTYGYDNRRLRTSSTQWSGATQYITQTGYDACGDISYAIDPTGIRVDFDHDALGHLLTVKSGPTTSQVTTLTNVYEDHRTLVHQQIDAFGNSKVFGYDGDQRLTDAYDELNRHTQHFYDADSNPTSVITPLGFSTTTLYDGRGLKSGVTDGESHTYNYEYDNNGRMTLLQNRLTNSFTWSYDDDNRVLTAKTARQQPNQPDASLSAVQVKNTRGLLSSITTPAGNSTSYDSYDNEGRLTQKTDSVSITTYSYWPNGLPKYVTDSGKTSYRHYDALNRLDQYSDGEGNTVSYDYYPNGKVKDIFYPNGAKTVTYDYDSFGRLSHITDGPRVTTYGYDDMSHLIRIDRPNGTYRKISYNAASEVTSIEEHKSDGSIFYYESLGYDSDGRITAQSLYPKVSAFTLPNDGFGYDVDNRLSTWNSQQTTLDADGNLTSGPLPSGAIGTYSYDARDRLTAAGSSSYRYSADGFRVEITGFGAASFVVDANDTVSRVLARTKGGVTTYYVYGIGLAYEDKGGVIEQYHYDHNGNTVAMTDSNQAVTDRWSYTPFGGVNTRSGSLDTPFQFAAQFGVQTDANGLCYMRARYYNPRIMRFVNADPIKFDGGLNWYVYGGNNPLSNTDPNGEWFGVDDAVFAGGGAVIGVGGKLVANWFTGTPTHWQDLVGAAVGGAAGGETLLYTANPILAGAAGGAAGNLTSQALNVMTGAQKEFSGTSLAVDTGLGAASGFLSGFSIAGVTAGRGSAIAVFGQIVTKAENNTISQITTQTAFKMGLGAMVKYTVLEGAFFTSAYSNVISTALAAGQTDAVAATTPNSLSLLGVSQYLYATTRK